MRFNAMRWRHHGDVITGDIVQNLNADWDEPGEAILLYDR